MIIIFFLQKKIFFFFAKKNRRQKKLNHNIKMVFFVLMRQQKKIHKYLFIASAPKSMGNGQTKLPSPFQKSARRNLQTSDDATSSAESGTSAVNISISPASSVDARLCNLAQGDDNDNKFKLVYIVLNNVAREKTRAVNMSNITAIAEHRALAAKLDESVPRELVAALLLKYHILARGGWPVVHMPPETDAASKLRFVDEIGRFCTKVTSASDDVVLLVVIEIIESVAGSGGGGDDNKMAVSCVNFAPHIMKKIPRRFQASNETDAMSLPSVFTCLPTAPRMVISIPRERSVYVFSELDEDMRELVSSLMPNE